jgi:hypothetical protein
MSELTIDMRLERLRELILPTGPSFGRAMYDRFSACFVLALLR